MVMATLIWAIPGLADAPKPFADFSHKSVKPPKPGSGKRINIQIDPEAQAKAAKPAAKSADGSTPKGTAKSVGGKYAWFWDTISPDVAQSGPGRLRPALIRIGNAPGGGAVASPRLQGLLDIARAHGTDILLATIGTDVSPALVLAVIAVESGGRVDAVSGAGANGLMQLMPATAARFGVTDVSIPAQNIKGGVVFLDFLMKRFGNDPILVLAAYNAGENSITKHSGVPPYPETRDYVPKVLAAFKTARGLCKTPPQLISDGCVFNVNGGE